MYWVKHGWNLVNLDRVSRVFVLPDVPNKGNAFPAVVVANVDNDAVVIFSGETGDCIKYVEVLSNKIQPGEAAAT